MSEADLHARHRWLVDQRQFRERMKTDPEYYDCRIAGWWVWGVCSTIGDAFLRETPQAPAGNLSTRGYRCGDAAEAFLALSVRLKRVNILCGDWERAVSESRTVGVGLTGVFLDPPYSSDCYEIEYAKRPDVSADVRKWAIENGENRQLRIALCGYEGEHAMPDTWECVAWKARGGYGSQSDGRGRENAARERIWFSPGCLKAPSLFS